jgi:cholesterol transport system auxiliary component
VLRPLAAPGFDDDHITLLRDGQKLDFYAGARWAAPLPEVIEQVAVEALRARGGFRAVLGDGAAFASGQTLQLEIVRCTAVYAGSGAPEVQVKLVASFGRRDDRQLLGTQLLEAKVQAGDNRLGAVAAAYERAVNMALAQLTPP